MAITVSTPMVSNALFFGAALVLVVVLALVLSRVLSRLLGLGLRVAKASENVALRASLEKRVARVIALLASAASLALIAAAIVLTLWGIDVTPRAWAWAHTTLLLDPAALAWRAGQLLGLVVAAVLVHRVLQALVGLAIVGLQRNAALARHGEVLPVLLARVRVTLRWGVLLVALVITADLLGVSEALRDPLSVVTHVVLGVLVARTLAIIADLGVDVLVQLIRAFEGHRTALRYLGRLDHLAGITKRTLEYFCFVGVATWVVHQLRPGTWLADTGLVAIRLIALIYVGRVLIAVVALVLREVLVADPGERSEAENQQRLTLLPVASSILRYAVYFCISVMALQELGVDSSPILAGAGLLGLAVGLGAQTLVGDVVSGFFILFEGLFLVGDRIRIGDTIGNVEEIGIRVLKIRDEFGVLHCIPNGEVRSVANHAHTYVNAVVEFALPYDADLPAIVARLKDHVATIRPLHPDILEETEFVVQDLLESGALIRCLTRVKPSRDDAVSEVLRGELLTVLVAAGVTPQACHVLKLHETSRRREENAVEPVRGA